MTSNGKRPALSPRALFLSGLMGGRKGERICVGNPTSIVCQELIDKAGVPFPDAHLEGEKMAELAAAGYEIAGFDTIMPEFSVVQESAALGAEIDWGHNMRMPVATTHPIQELDQLDIPENILEKPSMRVVLDAISILRREYGDRVGIIGKVMGPWTISYHLASTEEFLIWTITDPDKVHRYLEALKEVSIAFARAQLHAGADAVTLGDHATGDLVSPKTYQDFLLPVHQEMIERIGGPLILHICGNCADRLRLFVEAGFHAYHFEWQVDAKMAVDTVNGEMSLVGNINNAVTLLNGTPEDVYKQARYGIESGVDILAPECAIPLTTPLRNLTAIVEAAKEGY